jgi:uncharacterized protein
MAAVRVLAALWLVGCGRIDFHTTGDGPVPDTVVVPDGLVAYYPMDELAAAAAIDATGDGHTATCAMLPPPGGECPTVIPGHIGNAFQFDGATQIMRVASAADLDTTSGFTVAAWVQIAAAPSSRACFVGKGLGSGIYNSWSACIEPAQTVFFYTVTGATQDYLFSGVTVPTASWHHVAIRWDGITKTISLDGADVIADPAATDFDSEPIRIGSDIDNGSFSAPYAGAIDDLRIYNRALAPPELAELAAQ